MRQSRFLTLIAIGSLAAGVSACSNDPEPVSEGSTSPDTSSTSGHSVQSRPTDQTKSEKALDGNAATPPPSADKRQQDSTKQQNPLAKLDLNKRGNIVEDVSEDSSFNSLDGTEFVGFKAKDLITDFDCPAETARPSANGQYVAIHFSVDAHPELTESGWPNFTMSNRQFTVWGPDGKRVSDPVGNSAGCVPEEDLLPSPVAPGDNAEGLIILDVPEGSGAASFRMGGFEGSYGWEWRWQ
ncbi:hypothetical protein [Arthrobacter castelli]|uniref:hypothetical protein n=1 Tax=Arthrobacter castelli TaxID=271431 RepID=UPI000428C33D|nr:hypothetical protein [Arthrobacter castelli]